MPTRRLLLGMPLALAACGGGDAPTTLPPLITGYRHLTPLRLNVLEVEVPPATAAAGPQDPAAEMRRMAEERLVPVGIEGRARFTILTALFTRSREATTSGVVSLFAGDAGERIGCDLRCRLEILSPAGLRVGFVEAEARRGRTLPDGATPAARQQAAEEVLRQAMSDLNIEFEFHIRRSLRAWLVEGLQPVTPEPVEQQELPGAPRRA
jgi:hypothetical protein